MKKYLKNLFTFAFLFLMNMQIFGQSGWGGGNPYEVYWFTDMAHSLQWLADNTWFTPCNGGGSGGNGDNGGGNDPNIKKIMTYNIAKNKYEENGRDVIRLNGDIIAVQEIFSESKFTKLCQHSLKYGEFLHTRHPFNIPYGIALLWQWSNPPNQIITEIVTTGSCDADPRRGYIIGEWNDYIVVATHFPTGNCGLKEMMAEHILNQSIIQNASKPIFIAGDLNTWHSSPIIVDIFNSNGFIVRNYTEKIDGKYVDATRESGEMPDLILGNINNTIVYEIINKGIPNIPKMDFSLSDHLPYVVTIKIIS